MAPPGGDRRSSPTALGATNGTLDGIPDVYHQVLGSTSRYHSEGIPLLASFIGLQDIKQQREYTCGPLLHTAFLDALRSSRSFRSPHCAGEQAKAFGVEVSFWHC